MKKQIPEQAPIANANRPIYMEIARERAKTSDEEWAKLSDEEWVKKLMLIMESVKKNRGGGA